MELLRRDPNTDNIFKSLEIVKNFIIDKGLILTGGMVVDISLKMKGFIGIYNKEQVPDYDCLSYNFYEDSLELALILDFNPEGSVSVIPAKHVQTVRTRVNFVSVADITYADKEIFDRIPFLVVPDGFNESGMKIIDPHYQIVDQYRGLSYPMEGFPMYAVFNRLKKDIKRHDMLLEAYPFETPEPYEEKKLEINIEKKISEMFNMIGVEEDYLIFGETAYHYISDTTLVDTNGVDTNLFDTIQILSDSYNIIKNKLDEKKIKYDSYNRTLDIIPCYIEFTHDKILYQIYNNFNSRICKHSNGKTVHVNAIFMFLLFKYNIFHIKKYLNFYLNLKNITKPDDLLPDIKNMYGISSKDESYILSHEELVMMSETGKKESKRIRSFYPQYDETDEEKIKNLIEMAKPLYNMPEYKRDGSKV